MFQTLGRALKSSAISSMKQIRQTNISQCKHKSMSHLNEQTFMYTEVNDHICPKEVCFDMNSFLK